MANPVHEKRELTQVQDGQIPFDPCALSQVCLEVSNDMSFSCSCPAARSAQRGIEQSADRNRKIVCEKVRG